MDTRSRESSLHSSEAGRVSTSDTIKQPSLTRAIAALLAQKDAVPKWHAGGPMLPPPYRPPHHRYVTEKTIGEVVTEKRVVAAQRVRTDASNSEELRCKFLSLNAFWHQPMAHARDGLVEVIPIL
jgi:hypothetical protein